MHDFWILGYGDRHSPWTPADEKHYQLRDVALARNTFTLYPSSWTAIRVKFDNPGVAFSRTLYHIFTLIDQGNCATGLETEMDNHYDIADHRN